MRDWWDPLAVALLGSWLVAFVASDIVWVRK
jgi:hypothetical protein